MLSLNLLELKYCKKPLKKENVYYPELKVLGNLVLKVNAVFNCVQVL